MLGHFVMRITFRWGSCSPHSLKQFAAVWLEDTQSTRIVLLMNYSEFVPSLFFQRVVGRP